ncbi:MAG: SIMPL domain-containing protein [Chloroflexi bacterium]|nr:SIMPL domain-containing protein [Chloroflexota bacterium]
MRIKTLFVSVILLAALALSACGPATIVANPVPPQRTMNVNGTGMVMLTPDIAYINIGVHTELPTATEAVSSNTTQTQQVINALKNSGVDPKDIRTTNFSIYPTTQYDKLTGNQTSTTYVVDNTVYVTVRKLDKLGDLLDASVKAGANSINSIQFDVFDKSAAVKQARDAAVKDARTQAEELASASGVTLGDLQTVSFYDSIPTPMADAYGKGGGGNAMAASVPVSAGQLTITVTVNMVYEIK